MVCRRTRGKVTQHAAHRSQSGILALALRLTSVGQGLLSDSEFDELRGLLHTGVRVFTLVPAAALRTAVATFGRTPESEGLLKALGLHYPEEWTDSVMEEEEEEDQSGSNDDESDSGDGDDGGSSARGGSSSSDSNHGGSDGGQEDKIERSGPSSGRGERSGSSRQRGGAQRLAIYSFTVKEPEWRRATRTYSRTYQHVLPRGLPYRVPFP